MANTTSTTGAVTSVTGKKKFEPIYTEEKAMRLIRTYTAIVSMSLLIGWNQLMILHPLEESTKEMKHMDPSEISAIPLPLLQVSSFVMFPVVVLLGYWTVNDSSTLIWNMLNLVKMTGYVYALFALSGNYLVQNWEHSLVAALYVATLLASTAKEVGTSDIFKVLPFYDMDDVISTCRLNTTLLCTIPFQILSVLDHGMQIQRWPVPVLLGSTYGYAFGTLLGILTSYINRRRNENKFH
ncbi:hypothetical protein IV203_013103 [Nitzschia inconspicua]|uniref:Uncharacterized protein n=1 Tax=Nitzschia inconspicua TaxID=303405 RepID=A0A9K3Q7S6_9STRA|nr:hypothetical protein IV203_013103 [Nitzschia inconspicua]